MEIRYQMRQLNHLSLEDFDALAYLHQVPISHNLQNEGELIPETGNYHQMNNLKFKLLRTRLSVMI